ncbi:B-cell receptor CD22-like isoform X2 [Ctenopharyngodon idella]|uniref:B-cell receptor CD22-like isoform X2 n=1 Tax=Ctenopharyngodon idella TaxID=7959 RepID=UPI00222F0773|nr:B-cell receptor CD22-like isoform X2 [Ctenopharyngodon idella]
MVMSVKMAPLPLFILLMIQGVFSADWGVSYSPSHICAVKDSSVIMNCTYTYPTGHKIKKVFWTKGTVKKGKEFPDLSKDPEYKQRFKYLGDKLKNCTIRLSHVTLKDSHEYYFRFITDEDDSKWTGKPGVTLAVTDLQVESPERVTEGDSVRLTCKSSCTLTDRATFIWYRNSQPLTERRDRNNELLLQSVRREDAGRYSCAVHGHNHISPAVELNVMYPPKSASVSISPSGEIVSGDSVTLNCSSDSNPPALNFSWFKGGTFVGSGRIYKISKISSDDSGEYKCRSINEHGEKYSDAVTLNVMYPPRNVSVLLTGSGEIMSGDSVTLICSSDSNPPANISWFKGKTFVGSGRIYNISKISSDDSGEYKCKSINKHGEKYSDAVTLNVMYPPRNVSVLISGSGEIVSGDSVTLICSSDSNPPALNFSWFKENESSAVGSGQSFSALQSGRFYCQAHNQHGSQRSDAVTVTVKDGFVSGHNTFLSAAIVIVAVCAVLFFVCIIMFIRKRKCARVWEVKQKQVQQPSSSDGNHCDDGLYARVSPRTRTDQTAGKTESTDSQKISYATIQYTRDNEDTYENLRMDHPDPAVRSGAAKVIYSRIKGPIQDPSN